MERNQRQQSSKDQTNTHGLFNGQELLGGITGGFIKVNGPPKILNHTKSCQH